MAEDMTFAKACLPLLTTNEDLRDWMNLQATKHYMKRGIQAPIHLPLRKTVKLLKEGKRRTWPSPDMKAEEESKKVDAKAEKSCRDLIWDAFKKVLGWVIPSRMKQFENSERGFDINLNLRSLMTRMWGNGSMTSTPNDPPSGLWLIVCCMVEWTIRQVVWFPLLRISQRLICESACTNFAMGLRQSLAVTCFWL